VVHGAGVAPARSAAGGQRGTDGRSGRGQVWLSGNQPLQPQQRLGAVVVVQPGRQGGDGLLRCRDLAQPQASQRAQGLPVGAVVRPSGDRRGEVRLRRGEFPARQR
jgi:hypothetical protein